MEIFALDGGRGDGEYGERVSYRPFETQFATELQQLRDGSNEHVVAYIHSFAITDSYRINNLFAASGHSPIGHINPFIIGGMSEEAVRHTLFNSDVITPDYVGRSWKGPGSHLIDQLIFRRSFEPERFLSMWNLSYSRLFGGARPHLAVLQWNDLESAVMHLSVLASSQSRILLRSDLPPYADPRLDVLLR